jgi:hypothetical protein
MQSIRISQLAICLSVVALTAAANAQHEEDFVVGLVPDTNQIQAAYDPDNFPFALPKSQGPLLAGFALDDPGFLTEDAESPLNPDSSIALKLVGVSSPEFKMWDPLGPGEDGFQIIGDRLWEMGAPDFDVHPFWHIDTADPNYDPAHEPWSVTFRLTDLAGIHEDSDDVTVTFVPEPSAAFLLGLGALALARRWRVEPMRRTPASRVAPRRALTAPIVASALCIGGACHIALAQHDGDIAVGRSESDQLKWGALTSQKAFNPLKHTGLLTKIEDSYRAVDPGFDANFESEPDNDFFQLEDGADIWLVAERDTDVPFSVAWGGFTVKLAGDSLPLGDFRLHRHARFLLDASEGSGFDPIRTTWSGTFRFADAGGTGYADSDPFTLYFAIAACTRGDVNADGSIDFNDIDGFVDTLVDPENASDAARCAADIDRDGYVTFQDIDPFVDLLTGD